MHAVLGLCVAVAGCHRFLDVTAERQWNGDQIVGRCYVLRQGAYLAQMGDDPHQTVAVPTDTQPEFVPFGKFDPNNQRKPTGWFDQGYALWGIHINAILEPGTRIRVDNLILDVFPNSTVPRPLGTILDGPSHGEHVFIHYSLLHRTWTEPGESRLSRWIPEPDALADCGQSESK